MQIKTPTLWQVNIDLTDHDHTTLKEVKVGEDAVRLMSGERISNHWPLQTPGIRLEILV